MSGSTGVQPPPSLGTGRPAPPIALALPARTRLEHTARSLPDMFLERLGRLTASVDTRSDQRAEMSRDWWPLTSIWATEGGLAGIADAVVAPTSVDEVSAVLALANETRVPVTVAGGRSGVCGGTAPVFGGIVMDLSRLAGIHQVDPVSLYADVAAGTFGDQLEDELRRDHDLTVGHWPQSVALSTVGGWVACRGSGQMSNRYGSAEDLVLGVEAVLADGRVIRTGGHPKASTGPGLTGLFLGSEGTLGVITETRLRVRPVPDYGSSVSFGFASFEDGLEACRRIARRGLLPAVLRLDDPLESAHRHDTEGLAVLIAYDEGDPVMVDAAIRIVREECAKAESLGTEPVKTWFTHRNDVAALERSISQGLVVDTFEFTASWSGAAQLYRDVIAAISAVPGTVAATAHLSHTYANGACVYVTFAGSVEADDRDRFYRSTWATATETVVRGGAALSHHHGIGMLRSRTFAQALGDAHQALVEIKAAWDPRGILNPGKLALPSEHGPALPW